MENAETNEANVQNDAGHASVNVNSPDNRIAGRDYIEVNIHIESRPQRHRGGKSGSKEAVGRHASEIRHAVTEAINVLFPDVVQSGRTDSRPGLSMLT